MLHLLLAIVCSSSVAVLLRVYGKPGVPVLPVIAANYLAAVVLSILIQGSSLAGSIEALASFSRSQAPENAVPGLQETGAVWGMTAGIPLGVVYFLAFLVYRKALGTSGLGLSGGFAKMGILLPMVLSMLFWKEYPGTIQWIGIAVAVTAVALGAFPGAGGRFAPVLLLVFILNGFAEFGSKLYQHYGGSPQRDFFLLWVFTSALLCSIAGMLRKHLRFGLGSFAVGIPLGLANYFSSWFLIPALDELNAPVVFSLFGAGTVGLLSIVGHSVFGERLGTREAVTLLLVAAAIVLVNL